MPDSPPTREIYSRAPVMEAAIDIRCTNQPRFGIAEIRALAESCSDEFEEVGEAVETVEKLSADGARQIPEKRLGLMLRHRADPRAIWQVQVGGMTFSHTEPYERWEVFRDQGRRLWQQYSQAGEPQIVTRVGVRYINRMQVGNEIEDLRSLLQIYPVTPWNLTSPPAGFSLQIRMPRKDNAILITNLATITHVETSQVALLLDLDASIAVDLAPQADVPWNFVEQLHGVVEEAFESSITEQMRERIR